MVDYEKMLDRIPELPDTAASMQTLVAESDQATVQDWWLVFHVLTETVKEGRIWVMDEDGIPARMREMFNKILTRVEAGLKPH